MGKNRKIYVSLFINVLGEQNNSLSKADREGYNGSFPFLYRGYGASAVQFSAWKQCSF